MFTHTPATQGHTAPSARFTQSHGTHLGSHDHPAELPKAPTSTYTQPELYRPTQEPLTDTGIQSGPSRPHIMASHVDTRCHSLTHAGVRAHTHYSYTHKLSHTCSLRIVMVSHMETITLRAVHFPHRYHCTSKNSEPPIRPHPLTPLHPAVGNTHIHIQNSHSMLGPQVCQAVPGRRGGYSLRWPNTRRRGFFRS